MCPLKPGREKCPGTAPQPGDAARAVLRSGIVAQFGTMYALCTSSNRETDRPVCHGAVGSARPCPDFISAAVVLAVELTDLAFSCKARTLRVRWSRPRALDVDKVAEVEGPRTRPRIEARSGLVCCNA